MSYAVPSLKPIRDEIDANAADIAAIGKKMIVRDEKPRSTAAQAITANTWTVRDLNTVHTNDISGASLAANQITLPAGTYEIDAYVPAYASNAAKARLYDTTANAVVLLSASVRTHPATDYSTANATLRGRFVLAETSGLQIEQKQTYPSAGGYRSTIAEEIYTIATIEKVQ